MKKSILAALFVSSMLLAACSPSVPEEPSEPEESSEVTPSSSESSSEAAPSSSEATVYEVTLSQTTASVAKDETITLTATSNYGGASFVWASNKENIATVDQNGVVKGIAPGTAKISATLTGRTEKAECEVTVVAGYYIAEPTEILVQTTFNDTYGQVFKDAIEDLQKKEPHLTIKYDKYSGGYYDLASAVIDGIPANNYPDVVLAYPDSVADFINAGVPLKMDKYMNNADYGWSEAEKNDFYKTYLDEGQDYQIAGTYSLPIAKSTEGLYYDEDKIIGLSLAAIDPTINGGNAINEDYLKTLTWEEFFGKLAPALLAYRETLPTDAAKKAFLDQTTNSDWAVLGYDSDDNLFITLAEQYGYGYTSRNATTGNGNIDFVNDGMKNLIKTFNKAYENRYFTTKGIVGTNVNKRFNDDSMLFSIGSTGGVNYQYSDQNPKNVGVVRIPQAAGRETKLIQQGPSLAFLDHKKDENRANRGLATWLFYKELTNVTRMISWGTITGYSPIRKSVAESDDFLEFANVSNYEPKTLDRLKALNAGYAESTMQYLFSSPVFKGSAEARKQVGGLVTEALVIKDITDAKLNELFETAKNNALLKMK